MGPTTRRHCATSLNICEVLFRISLVAKSLKGPPSFGTIRWKGHGRLHSGARLRVSASYALDTCEFEEPEQDETFDGGCASEVVEDDLLIEKSEGLDEFLGVHDENPSYSPTPRNMQCC